ncbi:MAG: hypothetical protein HY820_44670 [Acidobacteria bacterium]|nr:hypothetical protein [Acidobacteriota bacterium]
MIFERCVLELQRVFAKFVGTRFPSLSPQGKSLKSVHDLKALDRLFAPNLTAAWKALSKVAPKV